MRSAPGVIFLALLICGFAFDGDGCNGANDKEARVVERQQDVYVRNQPAPAFDFSLDRYLMIELYKARNTSVATYSYVQSEYSGKVLWWCPSIGFPIPANTQLTNPTARDGGSSVVVLPQAEPNGLYSSPSTTGTYVMCLDETGAVAPRYEERPVMASLQPLHEVGGELVPVLGKAASFHIPLPEKHR